MFKFLFKLFLYGFLALVVIGAYQASRNPRTDVTSTAPAPPTVQKKIAIKTEPVASTTTRTSSTTKVEQPSIEVSNSTPTTRPARKRGLTLQKYLSVREGMTYDQVTYILMDQGTEVSSSQFGDIRTVLIAWDGPILSNMNVMFQNGVVVSKAQFGLPDDPSDPIVDLEAEIAIAKAEQLAEEERQAQYRIIQEKARVAAEKERVAAKIQESNQLSRKDKPLYQLRKWMLTDGSVIEGRLVGFGAGKVKFETTAGPKEVTSTSLVETDRKFIADNLR